MRIVPTTTAPLAIGVVPFPPILVPTGREGSATQTIVQTGSIEVPTSLATASTSGSIVCVFAEYHIDTSMV